MKRECLLSRDYTGAPMTFKGEPIYYSAFVNEIMREFKTAIFYGADDQSDLNAISECASIMVAFATGDIDRIEQLRAMTRQERHKEATTFAIRNSDEIDRIQPQLMERIQRAMGSQVESEVEGKPYSQAQDSPQP